jgi:hypothetical protein
MAQAAAMQASTRRFVYGTQVLITIALAVAVVSMAIWLAGRFSGRFDMTSAGRNSLSPRTQKLLTGLNTNITLTGTYTTALKEVRKFAEKHRNMVRDLLDLYETGGKGKVTTAMIDPSTSPADVQKLLKRLVEKSAYKDEANPHREAIKTFPELNTRIAEVVKSESDQINAIAQKDARLRGETALFGLRYELNRVQKDATDAEREIDELIKSEIPRYGQAVELARKNLTAAKSALSALQGWMMNEGRQIPGVADETRKFFEGAEGRYKDLLSAIEAELSKTNDLKRVKFEELYDALKGGECILVETDSEAAVIPQYEVFVSRGDRAPPSDDGDQSEFNGETAVSSAILRLTQKVKTAVIFVRHGGQQMLRPDFKNMNQFNMQELPRAPFGTINEMMTKENFSPEEWDLATAPAPPTVKDAAKTIYVIFPPSPPQRNPMMQQQPPMGMTPDQKQKILDAVRQGGLAIFMTGWSPPRSMFETTQAPYEYSEFLKSTWGIDVRTDAIALRFGPAMKDPSLRFPSVTQQGQLDVIVGNDSIRLTDHPIAKPLETLPAGLEGACPILLAPAASRPAGAKIETVIETAQSDDIWAVTDIRRLSEDAKQHEGTRRYESDIPSPFPIAVAGEGDGGQKVVVFASDQFISDNMLQMASLVRIGNSLGLAAVFPANADLFLNSLHWLTGESNRIAVGPSRGDVPRLDKLKEGPVASFWRFFLAGLWPLCAGLAGLGVWLIRRK